MLTAELMKVLVVEDDRDVRESLLQIFDEAAYTVDAVEDGEEGLYRAQEWAYDVIVLDVMLPKMDGWKVLSRLRDAGCKVPVLMLTALSSLDDRIEGLDSGADDYVVKPFNERELLARLRALHRRSTGQASNYIALGSVAIDLADRQVVSRGEVVKLTAAQYRIVAYLAARAGQVVSRQELAEAIIHEDESALSNVIDVQIHHIRRKLGKKFIHNRRGLGYMIPATEQA